MRDDTALIRLNLSNKYFRVSIHVLVWLAMLAFPFILDIKQTSSWGDLFFDSKNYWYRLRFLSYFYWIGLFYVNTCLLVPHFFNKSKYIYFLLSAIVLYAGSILYDYSLFLLLHIPSPFNPLFAAYIKLPAFLLTMAASTMYILIADRIKEELRSSERDKENLKSELSFLRSQISPHFIFNILNNIAAMVRLKSEDLEPTVMKLSGLMQYMLYNTDDDKVTLEVETQYLKSYIDLQKHRFGSRVNITTTFDIKDNQKLIEPMLLIPFVENAFKHGIGVIDNPQIFVVLKADAHYLEFSVINNFNDTDNKQKDSSSGIGIVNVTRRLQLLYGARQKLSILKKEKCFTVNLSIHF